MLVPVAETSQPAQPRARLSFLIHFAAFVIVIAGIREASDIVLQILVSVFAAVAVAPPIFVLQRKGVPFVVALGLVMAAAVGIIVGLASLVGSAAADFRDQLPFYEERVRGVLPRIEELLAEYGFSGELGLIDSLRNLIDPGQVMSLTAGLFAGFGGLLADGFLIFIMVIFLLLEAGAFPVKLQAAFGDRGRTLSQFGELASSVNRYLVIKTWLSLGTGLLAGLLCAVFGLDFAILWGVLAFLLNYVPNIGSILAAVPPALLAIVQLGPGTALFILIGYMLINNILGNVVEPRLMGQGLGLSTFAVVLSLIFWGWVLGPVGMLLSIPLTMSVKIAMEASPSTRWIAVLLGSGAAAEQAVETMRDASSAAKEPIRRSGAET